MPTGIEPTLSKAVGRVAGQLFSSMRDHHRMRRLRDAARPLIAQQTAAGLLDELSPAESAGLAGYLASPDFEQVALQTLIAGAHRSAKAREEHLSAIRVQIRHGIRLAAGLPAERLLGVTDVVLDAVLAQAGSVGALSGPLPEAFVTQGHLTAVGVRNGALLGKLPDLRRMHGVLAKLRSQVAHLHADLRMPHAGIARSVPWDHLYVEPNLHREPDERAAVDLEELAAPGARHVILGDPGAGKSTLAENLAHVLAVDHDGTVVPFIVVLRHFSVALQAGERTLAEHLVAVGRDPYNVAITAEMVEYLLMNGRALVILDGLDELIDVGLRRRLTDLVKGFVLLYPLVPVVATSRRVGYHEASLDPGLFQTCGLGRFDQARVDAYARRWFALDDGSPPTDRARLADSFLRESESIHDLRSSPLLLSVLCAMYATDHYIPENRGQVYERCAVMVFDRWDRMRGIARALGFEGRVRGAVQSLAWTLFNAYAVPEQPRSRILRILERHLIGKGFDEDEAAAVAADFLDYCAGRAWILAEVGSTATEPIFGFAHRTFLEYFTAEYLVRSARTPEQVWAELAPHVRSGSWEVVAQLALQLVDRNVDDGGDVVLRLALGDVSQAPPAERQALVSFCARSLGDVCVSPEVNARIVDLAVTQARTLGEVARFTIAPREKDFAALDAADGPLANSMYRSLPGNLPFVRRSLVDRLADLVEKGDGVARLLASRLDRSPAFGERTRRAFWTTVQMEFQGQHEAAFRHWYRTRAWARLRSDESAVEVMLNHGVLPFYVSDAALVGVGYPWVAHLLIDDLSVLAAEPKPLRPIAHDVRELLMRRPTPWLPRSIWPAEGARAEFEGSASRMPAQLAAISTFPVRRIEDEPLPRDPEGLATRLVLYLPYLEAGLAVASHAHLTHALETGRRGRLFVSEVEKSLVIYGIPEQVRDFLLSWVRGEVDLIGDGVPLPWDDA